MASYNELLALIDAYINRNGVQAITGQILNGVLKAMVDQLGRGYTLMGYAEPTGDPGTPDGPESWFASVPGTYTNYGEIQVAAGELALLSFAPSEGWTKNTIYEGFREVTADIDGNVGTPEVGVSYANGVLSFDFRNMKGNPGEDGDPAGFGSVTASVDDQVGTPSVSVSSSGPDTAKNFAFAFHNLKGETGVTSVVATVDNTSGNPQCSVSLQGGQLTLAFTGLKGAQGNTGSSVDYPFTIVNNLTTNDATQALSAAMGVQLESEVSQLEAKVAQLDSIPINVSGLPTVDHAYVTSAGKWAGVTGRNGSFIPVTPGDKVVIVAGQLECRYSYLTEIPTSASGGGTPPFVSGTGVNFLEAGGIVMVTIPSGSACLQINRLYGEDDYSPSYVTIVGGRFDKMEADILDNTGEIFNHSVYKNISGITNITHHYVNYSTGELVASDGWDAYRIRPFVGSKIRAKVGINLNTWASIAFYNSDVPKASTYISGVQGIVGSNTYEATVPAGTVLAIICNRRATDASPSISVYVDSLIPIANELSANSETLYQLTGNVEKKQSAFGRAVSRSAGTPYSDMTWVGDKLVAFNSSNDDLVSDPAKIVVYHFADGLDKPNTGRVTAYHTFGHCNTVDYCTENDCLLLGNGSGDYELAGQIFIIPNFSAIVQDIIDGVYENTTLTLLNTDAVVIDCEDYDLGTKFNAVWGEDNGRQYDIAYLITAKFGAGTGDGGDNGTIRRILLGRGSNSLQYGQLISGKSASEFNGTFAICDTYTQPNTKYSDGCNQGTCFHKGKIISAVNHDGLNIWSMRLDDGKIYRSVYSQKTFDPDGTESKHNISGICVKDGRMYIGGVDLGILCYDSIVE